MGEFGVEDHLAAGIGFFVFALLALRRKEEEELVEEEKEVADERHHRHTAWLTSFLVIFAAEWGDLTQLATAALVARTGQPLAVALGAVPALWTVTVLAALVGSQAGRFLSPTVLNRASAVLFVLVGAVVLATTLV